MWLTNLLTGFDSVNERKAVQLVRTDLKSQLNRVEAYVNDQKAQHAQPDLSLLDQVCARIQAFVRTLLQHDFNSIDSDDDDEL